MKFLLVVQVFVTILSFAFSVVNISISYLNYAKRDYAYSNRTGFLVRVGSTELDAEKEECSKGLAAYERYFQPINARNTFFTISIQAGYFIYFIVLIGWDVYSLWEIRRENKSNKDKESEEKKTFVDKIMRQLIKQFINFMFVHSTFFIGSTDFTSACIRITYPRYFLDIINICSYVVIGSVAFLILFIFFNRKEHKNMSIKVALMVVLILLYLLGLILIIGQLFGTVKNLTNSFFMLGKPALEIVLLYFLRCVAARK